MAQMSLTHREVLAMLYIYFCVFLAAPAEGTPSSDKLSLDQIQVIRAAVYDNDAWVGSPERSAERVLSVPPPLGNLYKKRPAAVLDVLLTIMEGANPKDSSLAAGYAVELLEGPGAGVVCVEFFDKKTYDVMDKNWETCPREHWIRVLANKSHRGRRQTPYGYGPSCPQ